MKVNATIRVNGRPLRRAYVEHLVFGVGTGMYLTDLQGRIEDNDSVRGIESATAHADIRIICQNPLVRVLDGNLANIGVYQDKAIDDDDIVNLNTPAEQEDYYEILNRVHLTYEVAFKHLSFFQNLDDPDFPFDRRPTLRETRDQAKRVDLIYPDYSLASLSWVEPKRLADNFPLMHIKHRDSDGRIFGEAGFNPTLIPHELCHALHFSFLTETQRGNAQDRYLDFILDELASGVIASHGFSDQTTPEVAYIEAGGIFAEEFMEFMRRRQDIDSTLVTPEPITEDIMLEFLSHEWSQVTNFLRRFGRVFRVTGVFPGGLRLAPRARQFFLRLSRLFRRPAATGVDVEGAVFAAIFVDFATQVGLDFAVSSYFEANAINFDEYRQFVEDNHPDQFPALQQAIDFWGLE